MLVEHFSFYDYENQQRKEIDEETAKQNHNQQHNMRTNS